MPRAMDSYHSGSRSSLPYARRQLQACIHSLHSRGWQERLTPVAQHMAARSLVQGRNQDGGPMRRLDLEVLRDALAGPLHEGDDDGLLVYQLAVADPDPAYVARQRGIGQAALLDHLRDAVEGLAAEYEDLANRCTETEEMLWDRLARALDSAAAQ